MEASTQLSHSLLHIRLYTHRARIRNTVKSCRATQATGLEKSHFTSQTGYCLPCKKARSPFFLWNTACMHTLPENNAVYCFCFEQVLRVQVVSAASHYWHRVHTSWAVRGITCPCCRAVIVVVLVDIDVSKIHISLRMRCWERSKPVLIVHNAHRRDK